MATEPTPSSAFQRPTAHKVTLHQIMNGEYIEEQEQKPNYIIINKEHIYKVNIVAAVVYKEEIGTMILFLLDDSTSRLICRIFEETTETKKIEIGNIVHIIGKIRVYNQEKYISPDVIKKTDSLWLKVRLQELRAEVQKKTEEPKKSTKIDEEEKTSLPPEQKILKIISELDKGDGVYMEEVIEESPLDDTEKWLTKMLERGDIFQNQPGKIKIL